jgi:DNA-binding response OmpR family regulator
MNLKNFLIIEDETDLSAIILNMIEVFGAKGQIADNADKAMKAIQLNNFDYFIIDLTLPDKTGLELYNDIVEHNPDYRGKAIFTSGLNVSTELRRVLDEHGAMFLAKPFTIEKFQNLIKNLL